MNLTEFSQLAPGLSGASHVEKIKHFAWFVLTEEKRERFATGDIRRCYEQLHYAMPGNLTQQLNQLSEKRPPDLLKDSKGFRLEGRLKEQFDAKYGQRQATVVASALLQGLPGRVSDEAERLFLSEALTCFRTKAFRAAIVMTWNLTYDHLLNWILKNHLAAFNAAIAKKFPKKPVTIAIRDDFEEFKEFDVVELCGTAGIINGNTKKILNEKLSRRNMAAHPSIVEIMEVQAEDVIIDLVTNVILKLA